MKFKRKMCIRDSLHFTVVVETPRNLSQKQKELIKEFGETLGNSNNEKKTSWFKKKMKF